MTSESVDSESKVSGNQANIPARIRRELDIDDGDKLRWQIEDDGTLRVQSSNSILGRSVTSRVTTVTNKPT